jgi:dipeptidyl aminopeptidase/acylaminoacyl peptidase
MKFAASVFCSLLTVHSTAVLSQTPGSALAIEVQRHEAAAPAALLDRQAFITPPALRSVLLSPDGRRIAYLADEGHDTALYLYDIETAENSRLFSSYTLATIHWMADSSHLLLNLGNALGAVEMEQPDRPAYIAALDEAREEQLLSADQAVLDHIFIKSRSDDGAYELEQVDIDGSRRELMRQDTMIVAALAVGDNAVVVESETPERKEFTLLSEGKQSALFSCALLETCNLLAWQAATNSLWLIANTGNNLTGLAEYSFPEHSLVARHSHARGIVDLTAIVLAGQQPVSVQYNDGLLQNEGLDAVTENRLRQIQALLPGSGFTPQISEDGSRWLITERSSLLQHPRYYLFNTTTSILTEILREERNLTDTILSDDLSERLPVQYPAQDGSTLYGYVSLPKGRPLDSVPMITLVHGGPFGRIYSSYSDFTQFLVNRGYIVFEPNFRASTGYGRAYLEQAAREFGNGLVQQDIIDGVHYLTVQGIGDPDRLAIAGHSFGGSAVLAGLAFTPELFKAGFASAPPADMAAVMQYQQTPERMANMPPSVLALSNLMFGAALDSAAMQAMTARSPLAKLSDVSAPLLLIAGGDDQQVPISHVKDYALALLNQQKTVSLFLDEDEGHGIGQTGKRSKLTYFWMAEEFFATYLGGRKQPLNDPELARYIKQRMLINTNPDFSVPVDD